MSLVNHGFNVLFVASLFIGTVKAQDIPTAIWVGDTDSEALDWSGSESSVQGRVHSNGGIKIGGSDNQFNGSVTWVEQFDNGGGDNEFSPSPLSTGTQSWPLSTNINNFQPNGSAAVAAGANYYDLHEICEDEGKWDIDVQGTDLDNGLYWVPCDVVFSASNLSGHFTIVSNGKIEISGSDQSDLESYSSGILFITSSNDDDAIKLSGSSMSLNGYLSAEQGRIELSGSDLVLNCGLFADRIKISGSNIDVTGDYCGVPVNEAPQAISDAFSLTEDVNISITLLGSDPENSVLTYTIADPPANGLLSGNAPNVVYTPLTNFYGDDAFTFFVSDGQQESSLATITLSVSPRNDPPTAPDQQISTNEDTSIPVFLTGSDVDGDALTYVISQSPTNGALSGTAPDLLYQPNLDYEGQDLISFIVDDGSTSSNEAIVTIDVVAVNDPPTAQSLSLTALEGEEISIVLESSDVDGDNLSISVTAAPQHGTISGEPPQITYSPDVGFNGSDQFEFSVSDGQGGVASGVIDLEILPNQNTRPIADAGFDRRASLGSTIIVQGIGRDEDNDVLTYNWSIVLAPVASEALLSVLQENVVELFPDYPGIYQIGLSVNDGLVDSLVDVVQITVTDATLPPTAIAEYYLQLTEFEQRGIIIDASRSLNGSGEQSGSLLYSWTVLEPANVTLRRLNGGSVEDRTETSLVLVDTSWSPTDVVISLVVSDHESDSEPLILTIPAAATSPLAIETESPFETLLGESVLIEANITTAAYTSSGACLEGSNCQRPWSGEYLVDWRIIERPLGSFAELEVNTDILVGDQSSEVTAEAELTPDIPGTYKIGLSADNQFPNGNAEELIIVRAFSADNTPPSAVIAGNSPQQYVVDSEPLAVSFDGSLSSDAEEDTLSFEWELVTPFGSTAILNNSTAPVSDFVVDVRGLYTLNLRVNDGQQYSEEVEMLIEVQGTLPNNPPTAIPGNYNTWVVGNSHDLDGYMSFDPDGDPLRFSWRLVATPTNSSPGQPFSFIANSASSKTSYRPRSAGTYVFELVVSDWADESTAERVEITVEEANIKPIANNGYPRGTQLFIQPGDVVPLDASASSDRDGDPLSYQWTLTKPANSAATIPDAASEVTSFTPDIPGSYSIIITVDDGESTNGVFLLLTVLNSSNLPPVTVLSSTVETDVGEIVQIDASGSFDPDGDRLYLKGYSLLSGPLRANVSVFPKSARAVNFLANEPGVYVLALKHSDGIESSIPQSIAIIVGGVSPRAVARAQFSTFDAPGSVQLDGRRSTNSSGRSSFGIFNYTPTVDFQWAIETQPPGSQAQLNTPTSSQPDLTVDMPGEYIVRLVVSDPYASSAPVLVTLTAVEPDPQNQAPIANAGQDQNALVDSVVELSGLLSSDPDQNPLTYDWSLVTRPTGSNTVLSNASSVNPMLTPDAIGSYVVELVVSDGITSSIPDSVTINAVNNNTAPTAVINVSPDTTVFINTDVELNGSGSGDLDGDSLTYLWEVIVSPPSSVPILSIGNEVTSVFTADLPGEYSIQLTVDDGRASAQATVTVTLQEVDPNNSPPTVIAGYDRILVEQTELELIAGLIVDVDVGQTIDSSWTINSKPPSSSAVIEKFTSFEPSIVFDSPGTYELLLTVTDGLVTVTDTMEVEVVPSTVELPVDSGLTGNSTLFGYDNNQNEIRDDVERFISANFRSDETLVTALNTLAKGYQNALFFVDNPLGRQLALDYIVLAMNCIGTLDLTQNRFAVEYVSAEQFNTIEREEKFFRFGETLDGTIIIGPRSDDLNDPCDSLDGD